MGRQQGRGCQRVALSLGEGKVEGDPRPLQREALLIHHPPLFPRGCQWAKDQEGF